MIFILLLLALFLYQVPQAYAQVTYISPKIGTGTDADPFRPHRTVGAWDDCVDLTSHFLCTGSVVPSGTGVVAVSPDASSRISAAQKTALQSVTGKAVTADTFDALMTDIIDSKGINLRPHTDNRQHLKIHGRELWSRTAPLKAFVPGVLEKLDVAFHLPITIPTQLLSTAVAWATTLATETFTATNGDLAGCEGRGCIHTWTEPLGGNWTIVSNAANVTVLAGGLARNDSTLATGDQEVSATLVSLSITGGGFARCGVIARKDNGATDTFYRGFADKAGTLYETQRRAAGATTSLATNGQDPVDGDVIRMRVVDDEVSYYVNDILLIGPTTDASPITSANTYTGIWANASTTTINCSLDNFNAADYSVAVSRRPIPPMVLQ